MIKQHMEIGLKTPKANSNQMLMSKRITLRDRIINALFGAGHKVVILVPGDSIDTISITENEIHEFGKAANKEDVDLMIKDIIKKIGKRSK